MLSAAYRYSNKNSSNLDSPSDEGGCKSRLETSTSFYQSSPIKITSNQPIAGKAGILRNFPLTARDFSTEKPPETAGITTTTATVLSSKQTTTAIASKSNP